MSENNNPFDQSNSQISNNTNAQATSSIPKVIGIISIILGTLGLIMSLFGLASSLFIGDLMELDGLPGMETMGFSKNYLIGSALLSAVTSVWAIFIGMKLLKYLDIGRQHYNYYTIVNIIISIFTFFYTQSAMSKMFKDMSPEMAAAASSMGAISTLSVFIAPIILIIVTILLNQQNVKDSLNH